ncbi:MAG: hypothetical protein GX963_01600 [Bacteroidales bacterium]|nr:hypothetical protein [Bacteroidales bacterium]
MSPKIKIKKVLFYIFLIAVLALGVFFYIGISNAEHDKEYDLFSLIPEDTKAVYAPKNRMFFLKEISKKENVDGSKNRKIKSKLLEITNEFITSLTPGFQMKTKDSIDDVLISFHAPYTLYDQVLYCKLNKKEINVFRKFVKDKVAGSFPHKIFVYKGEEIRIYTLESGEFIAFYVTPNFFAVSFQKKLLEKVIDAYIGGTSLLNDSLFYANCIETKNNIPSVYLKLDDVHFSNGFSFSENIAGWVSFDLNYNSRGMFFEGVSTVKSADQNSLTPVLALQNQTSKPDLNRLPSTTNNILHYSASNIQAIFDYKSNNLSTTNVSVDTVDVISRKDNTLEIQEFLAQRVEDSFFTLQFKDSLNSGSCNQLFSFQMDPSKRNEQELRSLYYSFRKKDQSLPSISYKWIKGKRYIVYPLPVNDLMSQFASLDSLSHDYATIYDNHLLLSADQHSLVSYIDFIEMADTLTLPSCETPLMKVSKLQQHGGYVNFNQLFNFPCSKEAALPSVFFSYADFFDNYELIFQLSVNQEDLFINLNFLSLEKEN